MPLEKETLRKPAAKTKAKAKATPASQLHTLALHNLDATLRTWGYTVWDVVKSFSILQLIFILVVFCSGELELVIKRVKDKETGIVSKVIQKPTNKKELTDAVWEHVEVSIADLERGEDDEGGDEEEEGDEADEEVEVEEHAPAAAAASSSTSEPTDKKEKKEKKDKKDKKDKLDQ